MYLLDIIAVTYNQNHELKCFVESLFCQTEKRFAAIFVHDGPAQSYFYRAIDGMDEHTHVTSIVTTERYNDWGHSLRDIGIKYLGDSKYTLFTNCDNYYVPTFIEEMTKYDEDLVYCNMVHNHWKYQARTSQLERGAIDCGAVVVKTELVKKIGWNHRDYAADWHFIKDCLDAGATTRHVNKVLFCHN